VHDAIVAEKAGIAATAIITDRFRPTAQAMAQVSGMPEFSFAVIPHPISNNDDAVLRAKAAEAVRQCAAILVRAS
jgi:sugar/nucleoside kinase (ribokinase family)